MDFQKTLFITALIILSVSAGYFKGKRRWGALGALGVLLSFYIAIYLS